MTEHVTAVEPTTDVDPDDICTNEIDGEVCGADLGDNEGYDGFCGPCADQLDEAGYWA